MRDVRAIVTRVMRTTSVIAGNLRRGGRWGRPAIITIRRIDRQEHGVHNRAAPGEAAEKLSSKIKATEVNMALAAHARPLARRMFRDATGAANSECVIMGTVKPTAVAVRESRRDQHAYSDSDDL